MHVVTIVKDPVLKGWYVMVKDYTATNAKSCQLWRHSKSIKLWAHVVAQKGIRIFSLG